MVRGSRRKMAAPKFELGRIDKGFRGLIDLQSLAQRLSQQSHHRVEDWFSILNATIHDPAFAQMTDGEINHLVKSLHSPEQLHWLLELFRDAYMRMSNEMPFDFLVQHVNQTIFTLQDWLETIQLIHHQAEASGQKMDLKELIAVANRSMDLVSSATNQTFAQLVKGLIDSGGLTLSSESRT